MGCGEPPARPAVGRRLSRPGGCRPPRGRGCPASRRPGRSGLGPAPPARSSWIRAPPASAGSTRISADQSGSRVAAQRARNSSALMLGGGGCRRRAAAAGSQAEARVGSVAVLKTTSGGADMPRSACAAISHPAAGRGRPRGRGAGPGTRSPARPCGAGGWRARSRRRAAGCRAGCGAGCCISRIRSSSLSSAGSMPSVAVEIGARVGTGRRPTRASAAPGSSPSRGRRSCRCTDSFIVAPLCSFGLATRRLPKRGAPNPPDAGAATTTRCRRRRRRPVPSMP